MWWCVFGWLAVWANFIIDWQNEHLGKCVFQYSKLHSIRALNFIGLLLHSFHFTENHSRNRICDFRKWFVRWKRWSSIDLMPLHRLNLSLSIPHFSLCKVQTIPLFCRNKMLQLENRIRFNESQQLKSCMHAYIDFKNLQTANRTFDLFDGILLQSSQLRNASERGYFQCVWAMNGMMKSFTILHNNAFQNRQQTNEKMHKISLKLTFSQNQHTEFWHFRPTAVSSIQSL